MNCLVAECKNTIGAPFPQDPEFREKWLRFLKIDGSELTSNSFVCHKHFKDIQHIGKNISQNVKSLINEDVPQSEGSSEDLTIFEKDSNIELINVDSESLICRICMSDHNLNNNLCDQLEGRLTIKVILSQCVESLEFTEPDNLPQKICSKCLGDLKVAYKFHIKCLETDNELRRTTRHRNKRQNEEGNFIKSKRVRIKEVINGAEVVYEKSESEDTDEESEKQNFESIKMENNFEETIQKGFKVESDELCVTPEPVYKKVTKIHIVDSDHSSKEVSKPKTDISVKTSKEIMKEINILIPNLPKGIKIKPAAVYESKRGVFPSKIIKTIYNTNFILSGEYLYVIGLLKNRIRQLQCIITSCKAQAEQKLLMNEEYEENVLVKIPHNHNQLTQAMQKEQMFFHIMIRKLHHDKTLNIRSIYEDICSKDPELKSLIPLRNVINEICRYQSSQKVPHIKSFEQFYDMIENDCFEKLHFTHSGKQFYHERFSADDGSLAILFSNVDDIDRISDSTIMYVDASFKIETKENFKYQLVTALVWIEESYYPILFALINKKTQEIFRRIFRHLHDVLAPKLRPHEIITDYEAQIYYALGETYLDSHIGGSVFYYTQNIYKKLCSLNLSRDLETNSFFRNVYHMLLMLPLLPVNTILDGLNNIEIQAKEIGLTDLTYPIFQHIKTEWILNVTPDLFCVHRLENRINENVIAPFKKLRDFLLVSKGKSHKYSLTIINVVEKLKELEAFLIDVYGKPDKKAFARDLSSSQKKNVIRAWQYIESHPKININNFFAKVLGYIKCMENQLWIWGFYRYTGDSDDTLINANNFSIIANNDSNEQVEEEEEYILNESITSTEEIDSSVVLEAVIDENGGVVLQSDQNDEQTQHDENKFENSFLKYVYE